MESIHGAPSHILKTPTVTLAVTAGAGHLAPATFHLPGRDLSPYALAPWEPAEFPDLPPLLSVLRGDFLCLPFGPQTDGPPHGDPANAEWNLVGKTENSVHLAIDTKDTGAHVEKLLTVQPGHHAIYHEHRITNLDGDWSYGNHPILDLSSCPEGSARVAVSPFRWASTYPGAFSNPAAGETQCLAPDAAFTDLAAVPLAAGGTTDLTRYPVHPGNDDLVMMVNQPATAAQPFAWSAVTLDGAVWFSLKNPADFPATLFWLSNGGRSAPPWSGRHLGRLGIEEVCSHFCNSIDESRKNLLAHLNVPTTRHFSKSETTSLRIIQAVAQVPKTFGLVTSIKPNGESAVTLTDDSNTQITLPLNWPFLSQ
jgi:hypothetical protein